MKSTHSHNSTITVLTILILLFIGACVYTYLTLTSLSTRLDSLTVNLNTVSSNLASTTSRLEVAIANTNANLSSALGVQQQSVSNIQMQLGSVQSQVGSVSGTVNTLQKLAKTDPELLKKYSKVYFLSDNYIPARLSIIPDAYQYSSKKQMLLHSDTLPFMQSMVDAAAASGIKIYAQSAYRSFAEQRALKDDYTITYGAGTANSFAADQGYSEHQLGTTVDFIAPGLGGDLDGFDKTTAYTWMVANAYKYGFILSYPKGNPNFVYEPWHWRFVGVKLATTLHNQGLTFYDLDQRTIDGYLVSIFDPN